MNVWIGVGVSATITLGIAIALWRVSVVIIDRTPRKTAPKALPPAPTKVLEADPDAS